ncbi:MAG: SMI1/KNR4 family protein [Verrucomicrobiaceae bacterium]|nr:SMI1/KNR4 family protein [Verrucomicrobiaceae bacterium]
MSIEKTIAPISHVALKEDDLEHLESRLGVKLPQDYKIFMMLHNGGKPAASVFNFAERGAQTSASVRRFFALDDSHKFYSLNKHISIYHGRHPPGMVPVACDSFGNLILLECAGEHYGNVFFWDHENEDTSGSRRNLSLISRSFAEFLSLHAPKA